MLRLTTEQAEALEDVELLMLQQRLADHLAVQWPSVADKLGARFPQFVEFTLAAASEHQLRIALSVLRYVNLCCVWGSSFEKKPDFEWASSLLRDPRMHEWQKMHQLVRRSVEHLSRRSDPALPASSDLDESDARLMQVFAGLGMNGRLLLREGVELPVSPCDFALAAIRVSEGQPRFVYLLAGPSVSRPAAPSAPPPLRIDAEQPIWPERIHVLAPTAEAGGKPARLQLRTVAHASCNADWHPHVALAGTHGLWDLRGSEARAISWPLLAPATTTAVPALKVAVAEETAPDIMRLQFSTCALREQGLPLGSGAVQVWTYCADQCLMQIKRAPSHDVQWPQQRASGEATRVELERNGNAVDATGWTQGFNALDAEVHAALARLGAAWERSAGLERASLTATTGMLCGGAALAWGWHQGEEDLRSPILMQLQAVLQLQALAIDLQCAGELREGGAQATLRLYAQGEAPLNVQVVRTMQAPTLVETAAELAVRFRIPFRLEVDSITTSEAATLHAQSPCSGALVGEAGLRPRSAGGSGWQWFANLRVEPAVVEIMVDHPFRGQSRRSVTLLPAIDLLRWSLG